MNKRARHGIAGFLAVPVLLLRIAVAPRANAFTYPEHERMSRLAWRWMLDKYPDFRTFVTDAARAHPGAHLCPGAGLDKLTGGADCFTVADLPALAADHARTPADLITRWFEAGDAAGNKSFGGTKDGHTTAFHLSPSLETAVAFTF